MPGPPEMNFLGLRLKGVGVYKHFSECGCIFKILYVTFPEPKISKLDFTAFYVYEKWPNPWETIKE